MIKHPVHVIREATIERKTNETAIALTLDLDGTGKVRAKTGVPFFDHMLDALGRHGRLDLVVACTNRDWTVRAEDMRSRGANCPFVGHHLRGRVLMTVRAGTIGR